MVEIIKNLTNLMQVIGTGKDMTTVLLSLVAFDIFEGIRWRVKHHHPLWSHNFNVGVLINCATAVIPLLLETLYKFNHATTHIYRFAEICISIGIFLSIMQSIIANYYLIGHTLPSWLDSIIHKYIGEEIRVKEERVHDQTIKHHHTL